MTPSTSSNTSTSTSAHSDPLARHAEEFDQLGRSFCVLYEIWPRPAHLTQPFPESLQEIGPWHPQRYRNDQSKREAIVAEIYNFVPVHFHEFLEAAPSFSAKVCAIITIQSPCLCPSVSSWCRIDARLHHQQYPQECKGYLSSSGGTRGFWQGL